MLKHASDYYADLFGPAQEFNIQIDPNIWESLPQLSDEENDLLCSPFTEAEIKSALIQMEKNKAVGPNKIPIEFYQSCWDIIKNDIVQFFDDFHKNRVDISRINYGIITLLPKIKEATRIHQFCPICLMNCLYKLVTKTLTIRMEKVADILIHNTQTTFMKGRNIMSGILCLHKILHETK